MTDNLAATTTGEKPRSTIGKPLVDAICDHAQRHGLSAAAVDKLIRIVASPKMIDQSSQTAIAKHLYLREVLRSDTVFTIVNALGHGNLRASATTQHFLLRWLTMIFEFAVDRAALSSLYSVLFNLLDILSLRQVLCHLLAKMTRKKHVKPFRHEILRQLSQGITTEPAVVKLLRIYDSYASSDSSASKTTGVVVFSHPDRKWAETLKSILRESGSGLASAVSFDDFSFDVQVARLLQCKTSKKMLSLMGQDVATLRLEEVDELLAPLLDHEMERLGRGDEVRASTLKDAVKYIKYTKVVNHDFSLKCANLTRMTDITKICCIFLEGLSSAMAW